MKPSVVYNVVLACLCLWVCIRGVVGIGKYKGKLALSEKESKTSPFKIAAFNVKVFGRDKVKDQDVMDVLVKVSELF